ncbi:MAG: Rieske (2Fe-2S) protein [Actinobacteria bacterium]|nr:Rieske (2Fe-2S) protein [Actinomycetota bacterium]
MPGRVAAGRADARRELIVSGWVRATGVRELPEVGGKVFRHLDKRISLFRTPSGVHAVDNRCPHEGYALARGRVKDDVLTCQWHNWKFDLATGTCLFGGEGVRTYPVEIRGDDVYLDITDPEPEELEPRLFASLLEAMGRVDVGRIARDAMRLHRIGTPLAEVVREGLRFGAPRAEYGWNHSLATLVTCLDYARLFDGPLAAMPVVQGLAVVSETEVRRPLRPRPDPVDPTAAHGSVEDALAAFPRLVNDERADDAEALLRGLLAAQVPPQAVRHALLTAITDHFLGYGHPLIYCQKAFELLDTIGWEEADSVLGPLVPNTVLSTRYDDLPWMRRFLVAWEEADVDLGSCLAGPPRAPFDRAAYLRAVIDGSPEDAVAALARALRDRTQVPAIIDATAVAASERFLRFDLDLDLDDTNEWGWLDVTHTMTYLDALRWAWAVDPSREILRGLVHAVWFVQWSQRFDASAPAAVPARATDDVDAVLAAIRKRDPEAAVALVSGFRGPAEAVDRVLGQAATEDNSVAPIMVAHTVKTAWAASRESRATGDRRPVIAAARFLAAPKRERWVYQSTLEAVSLLQGRVKDDTQPRV